MYFKGTFILLQVFSDAADADGPAQTRFWEGQSCTFGRSDPVHHLPDSQRTPGFLFDFLKMNNRYWVFKIRIFSYLYKSKLMSVFASTCTKLEWSIGYDPLPDGCSFLAINWQKSISLIVWVILCDSVHSFCRIWKRITSQWTRTCMFVYVKRH